MCQEHEYAREIHHRPAIQPSNRHTHTMNIRAFQTRDEQAVIALWAHCNLVMPWNNPAQDIKRKQAVNPELFLVGEQDDSIIASVMGGYDGHRGWINYLAVHPDHQRRGYGRKMMLEVETRIRETGCPKINLQIRASNTQVIAFYRAIGFLDDKVVGLGKRLREDEPQSD